MSDFLVTWQEIYSISIIDISQTEQCSQQLNRTVKKKVVEERAQNTQSGLLDNLYKEGGKAERKKE